MANGVPVRVGVKEIVAVGVVVTVGVVVGVGGIGVIVGVAVAVAVAVGVAWPNRLAEPATKKTTENTRTLTGVIRIIISRALLLSGISRKYTIQRPTENTIHPA